MFFFKLRLSKYFIAYLMGFVALDCFALQRDGQNSCLQLRDSFLARHSENTYQSLELRAECEAPSNYSPNDIQRLVHLTGNGNRWAAQYLAKNLKQFDGGDLEDALVGLGKFSTHNMASLMGFLKNGTISERNFCDALTMLPLSISDDQHAQLVELDVRRRAAIGVKRQDLSVQRKLAIDSIDKFVKEVRPK